MSLTRLKSRFGQGCIPPEGSAGEWISLSFPASVNCNPWLQAIFKANLIRQSSSHAALISLVFSLLLPFPIKELCDVLSPHR